MTVVMTGSVRQYEGHDKTKVSNRNGDGSCHDTGPVSLGTGKMKDRRRERWITSPPVVVTVVQSVSWVVGGGGGVRTSE